MTCDDAIKVLKEVQYARETLENNIRDVYRQHERADLFSYFRHSSISSGDEENHRIRKKISEKIKEIHNEIHEEVYANKSPVSKPAAKTYSGLHRRGDLRQPLTQLNKKTLINNNNVNSYTGLTKAKAKSKKTKTKEVKKPDPPPVSSTAYDELVFQHVYGRQPHQPHRHTIRHVNNRSFCSPQIPTRKVPPHQRKTEPVPAKPISSDVVVQPINEYCIHVQSHDSPFSLERNFPNAIPLVEPSRCLSDRLPITITEVNTSPQNTQLLASPQSLPVRAQMVHQKKLSRAGPNVAVINMKADDMSESGGECSSAKQRIKAKARERMRCRMKLNIQPLPNVDIDTTDPSSLSSTSNISLDQGNTLLSATMEKNDMVEENHSGNAQNDFQDFISVQDMPGKTANATDIDEEDDEEESIYQPEIFLPGCKSPDEPVGQQQISDFPPQNFLRQQTNVMDILPVRVPTTLEQNAHDWIEKEILARLITEMVEQDQREPLTEFAKQAPTETPDVDGGSGDWIDDVIGLRGLQLFVDAGVPVNKDLVRDLIKVVIVEYLETLYGYPPPEAALEPLSEDVIVDAVIPTPPQTPLPVSSASLCVAAVTPNQTVSELSEPSVNDFINDPSSVHEEDTRSVPIETLQTPEVSFVEEETDVLNKNITTPDMSLAIEEKSQDDVGTPENSEVGSELMQIPLSDFEFTENIDSPERSAAIDDKRFSPTELELTPPPIVVTKRPPIPLSSLSTPSTTYHSTSNSVGFSTFEGISLGEYMNSNSGLSEGSVGELRLPPKHVKGEVKEEEKVDDHAEEVDERKGDIDENSIMKGERRKKSVLVSKPNPPNVGNYACDENLSVGEVNRSSVGRELKSIGEVSDHSHLDTDDTSFATAGKVEILKMREKDPMLRLLDKIDSTRDCDDDDDYFFGAEPSYKSEGEFVAPSLLRRSSKVENSVSLGENISKSIPIEVLDEKNSVPEASIGHIDGGNRRYTSDNKDVINNSDNDRNNSNRKEDGERVLGASSGNVIVVQPATINVNKQIDFSEKRTPTDECNISTNNTYSHIQDISQSEGELLESDTVGEVHEEMSEVVDLPVEQENDKVVMVLRLPEVEDDEQNVTDDYDVSRDDVSTISEL